MSEPTTPVCPGCGQSDRVDRIKFKSDGARALADAEGPLAHFFCDRCHSVLSALPAIPARPASGVQSLPGCEE